jgi:serine/threonine protein kinase
MFCAMFLEAVMSDLVGKFISHYRLDALLGDGGMGTVYRAYDTNLERTVALKLMHVQYARQPEFQARLSQEARTAAQLDHPSIVRIFDFGESDEGLYIAMEYVSGGNLRSHLMRLQQRRSFLPLKQSLQIGAQIADALDYAHREGVIHRDVKPGNIILKPLNRPDEPGEQPFRAVLTDFGLVKLVEGDSSLTRAGTTLGTPTYMSPEQCEGLTLDGRSDLYSLGVVLYELVTNQLPFQFKSLSEAMATHMRGEMPHLPRLVRAELPPIIDSILTKVLAKAPSERYQSGRELANALRSAMVALEEAPTQVMAGGGPQPMREESDNMADEPPQGYRLEIKTPGRESSYASLSRPTITIGRNADNDIVLPADGVSRYHARTQATRSGWEVVDLGGVNGTWLNERKLQPNVSTPIQPGDTVQVGPYQLVLEGPPTQEPATVPQPQNVELPTNAHMTVPYEPPDAQDPSEAPLEIFLARDTLSVEPGRRVELKVEVANRSQHDDRVNLRVFGVPSEWVQAPDTFIAVPAGGSTTIPIMFQPPRRADTPSGRQRVRIELNSQTFRRLRSALSLSLMLGTFEDFTADMTPRNLRLPGIVQIALRNTGNTPAEYSVVGREQGEHIQFRGERGRIQLLPDQLATIDLQLEQRSKSWFGGFETYGFEVDVASRSGARQSVSGNAEAAPIIPISLGYGALFILVFLCALSAFFLGRNWLGGTELLPTVTGTIDADALATATAFSATLTAEATGTAGVPGDRDGDGLSDSQEAVIGTLPDNPDTDGDGLEDGQEVLSLGTSPNNRDSDGDGLSDGDEVLRHRTNPLNPDSDGDGVNDAAEIAGGTNPLDPSDGPATPTPTPSPATITPSPTWTPSATTTQPPGNLPDLLVPFTPAITYETIGCFVPGTELGTRVTIRNAGTANAGNFVININGTQQLINGLIAGGDFSVWVPGYTNPTVVVLDVTNQVAETNEANNTFNGSVPVPTQPAPCVTETITPMPTTPTGPTITPTFTGTPSVTPTGTGTPTLTPTGTSAAVINPVVSCVTVLPTLDGVMQPEEWGPAPAVEFGPQGSPEYNVAVYILKNTVGLYLAFQIEDPTFNELTDSLRVYFDVTNNAGDPDSADRFFQITRDGTTTVQAGTETNTDSLDWDNSYSSNNWSAVVGEPGGNSWVVEMAIDAAEVPVLMDGNPFGMMSMVLYTGLLHSWPVGSVTDDAGTWQEVDNQVCQ